jgi:hypothetical protein
VRVEGVTLDDWHVLLDLVHDERWPAEPEVPRRAADLFPDDDTAVSFGVTVGPDLQLVVYALTPTSIDFDCDTAQIRRLDTFEALLAALAKLARALSHEILVSHEGASHLIFLTVSPTGAPTWLAPG